MGPTLPNTTNGRAFPSNANDMGRGRRHARHCNGSILLMTVCIVDRPQRGLSESHKQARNAADAPHTPPGGELTSLDLCHGVSGGTAAHPSR